MELEFINAVKWIQKCKRIQIPFGFRVGFESICICKCKWIHKCKWIQIPFWFRLDELEFINAVKWIHKCNWIHKCEWIQIPFLLEFEFIRIWKFEFLAVKLRCSAGELVRLVLNPNVLLWSYLRFAISVPITQRQPKSAGLGGRRFYQSRKENNLSGLVILAFQSTINAGPRNSFPATAPQLHSSCGRLTQFVSCGPALEPLGGRS